MCCHQGYSFWLKYAPNCSAGGALPQTILGELTEFPKPLAGKGYGKGGEGREHEGGGKGSEGRLTPLEFKSGYTPMVCM